MTSLHTLLVHIKNTKRERRNLITHLINRKKILDVPRDDTLFHANHDTNSYVLILKEDVKNL